MKAVNKLRSVKALPFGYGLEEVKDCERSEAEHQPIVRGSVFDVAQYRKQNRKNDAQHQALNLSAFALHGGIIRAALLLCIGIFLLSFQASAQLSIGNAFYPPLLKPAAAGGGGGGTCDSWKVQTNAFNDTTAVAFKPSQKIKNTNTVDREVCEIRIKSGNFVTGATIVSQIRTASGAGGSQYGANSGSVNLSATETFYRLTWASGSGPTVPALTDFWFVIIATAGDGGDNIHRDNDGAGNNYENNSYFASDNLSGDIPNADMTFEIYLR